MKKIIATTTFILCISFSFGQDIDSKRMIDSIKYIQALTLDCNVSLFWRIVKQGDKAIPYLIEKITDSTATNVSSHCKKTKLNVGEVAYEALDQIAYMPMIVMTHIQFDTIYDGCWSFYDYFYNNANKSGFQKLVKEWFAANAKKYKTKKIATKDLTECQRLYKIETYYKWIE